VNCDKIILSSIVKTSLITTTAVTTGLTGMAITTATLAIRRPKAYFTLLRVLDNEP